MIVPQAEIEFVTKGRCRRLLLPMLHGDDGELLLCSLDEGECFSLQPRPFRKGVKVTVSKDPDTSLASAITGARITAGRAFGLTERVWVVEFVLGDLSDWFEANRERYLKAKGVGLTTNPAKGVRGEGAVIEPAIQAAFTENGYRNTVLRQEAEAAEAQGLTLHQRVARLEALASSKRVDVSSEIRAIKQRIARAERRAS